MMRALWALLRRELLAIYSSPIAWVVLATFLLLSGIYFYEILWVLSRPAAPYGTPMAMFFGGSLLSYVPLLLFVSAITMRTFAEEEHSGTIEPLLTAPVGRNVIVAAKFLGAWIFYLSLWAPTAAYPLFLWSRADPAFGPIAAGYLGVALFGAALTALGLLASALARTQIVAAILSFGFGASWLLAGVGAAVLSPDSLGARVLRRASVFEMMDRFRVGIADSRDVVFCVSLSLLALLLCRAALDVRRAS
ncbi:MAG: ABC transporter permease subunit [Deltaproteobacteria bacterium]|nr:ABC transporter permease subunit [Deltaproteobacteria bacterium]